MISVELPFREMLFFSFLRYQISCGRKQQVETNKKIRAMLIALKVSLEC